MRSNKPIEDREENNQSAFSAPVFDYVVTAYAAGWTRNCVA